MSLRWYLEQLVKAPSVRHKGEIGPTSRQPWGSIRLVSSRCWNLRLDKLSKFLLNKLNALEGIKSNIQNTKTLKPIILSSNIDKNL